MDVGLYHFRRTGLTEVITAFLTERGTGLYSVPFVQLSRLIIGSLLSNILGTLLWNTKLLKANVALS